MKKLQPPYKIIFMGTPDFAVPALEALIEQEKNNLVEVCAVVTQPDKPKGRGRKLSFSPVKEIALQHNKTVFQPFKVNDPLFIEEIAKFIPHFFVVAAFGKILSQRLLDIPEVMPINIHGSILPKYRGAAPIQWSILNGDKTTGITIMKMDAGMDTGTILLQESIDIASNETCGSLFQKMSVFGAKLLIDALNLYKDDKLIITPQPEEGVTMAPPLKENYNLIDWNNEANSVSNLIKATDPQPGAYSFYNGERINFFTPVTISFSNKNYEPGSIIQADERLVVATGSGLVNIGEVQKQGKKRMSARDFLRGARLKAGDKFG